MKNSNISSDSEDEIDVIKILRVLWLSKKRIVKITLIFILIGVFVAVFSQKEYTASVTILPQSSKKVGGDLGGLAALAGVNLGSIGEVSIISPKLYPQIMNNISFQKEMLETLITIKGQDSKITYKKYYTDIYSPGFLGSIKKVPNLLIGLFRSDDNAIDDFPKKNNSFMHISKEDKSLIELLNSQLSLKINEKEGYITLSGVMPEAMAAAEFTKNAQKLLEKYVINFKIKKSKEQLNFIKNRYLEKEKEFKKAQQKLALYVDQNQNVSSARAKIKSMYLQSEYDLIYGVFLELAKQLEAQEIKVKEDTPIFTILEPIFVPIAKAKPNRLVIVIVWSFFGFVLSISIILATKSIQNILKKINNNREN